MPSLSSTSAPGGTISIPHRQARNYIWGTYLLEFRIEFQFLIGRLAIEKFRQGRIPAPHFNSSQVGSQCRHIDMFHHIFFISIPHRQARNAQLKLNFCARWHNFNSSQVGSQLYLGHLSSRIPDRISIPHRQARNRKISSRSNSGSAFQFLIGRLAMPAHRYVSSYILYFNSSQVGSQLKQTRPVHN